MKLREKEPLPGNNQDANLLVDRCCNNCGACRFLCPGVFGEAGLRSRIMRDPLNEVK